MKYKIIVPNTGFCGERLGVKFEDGIGFTEDPLIANKLELKGYVVSGEKETTEDPWKDVTVKMIDPYAQKIGFTFADGVKTKAQKIEGFADWGITPEMVSEGIAPEK